MAVARRQRREKPAKIEQKKVRGPERGPQVQQTLLAKPNLHRAGPGGGKKHIKGGAKALSHELSLPHVRALFLSLSLSLPMHSSTFFSSSLWVGMPSHFEDGFFYYLLNKIEL